MLNLSARHAISWSNQAIERRMFFIFCVLSASPLLFSHYPPMVDIPQHVAQVSTLNRLFSPDFHYAGLYSINWETPYLAGYLLLGALSKCMPILVALKLLLAIVVISIPLAISRLRVYFQGDPAWDWLSLSIGYGFAFQWGFLNFLIGVPIVLMFLLSAFRYADDPNWKAGCKLSLYSILLVPVHILITAFGCGLACLYIAARNTPAWRKKFLTMLPFFSPLILAVPWLIAWLVSSGVGYPVSWDLDIDRPMEFLSSSIGMPSNFYFTPYFIIVGAIMFALPFVSGARFTRHTPRLVMFGAFLVWMMFGPGYLLGNAYTYNRFAIFGLPLFIITLVPSGHSLPGWNRASRIAFYLLPAALILMTCLRFAAFDRESEKFGNILQAMRPDKRVMSLVFDKDDNLFFAPVYLHFPSWYQVESTGIVDFSFSQFKVVLLRYRHGEDIPVQPGFEWRPESFNWKRNQAWLYDYFVVSNHQDIGSRLFAESDCKVTLVANSGQWWLYERELGNPDDKHSCFALHKGAFRNAY